MSESVVLFCFHCTNALGVVARSIHFYTRQCPDTNVHVLIKVVMYV